MDVNGIPIVSSTSAERGIVVAKALAALTFRTRTDRAAARNSCGRILCTKETRGVKKEEGKERSPGRKAADVQLGEKLVSLGQSTFGVRLDSRSSGPGVTRKLPPPDWLGATGNPFIRTKTLSLLSQRIQVCFFFFSSPSHSRACLL